MKPTPHTGVRCKLTFLEDFPRTSASIINTAALSHAARSEIRNSNYSREIEKKGEKREREGRRGEKKRRCCPNRSAKRGKSNAPRQNSIRQKTKCSNICVISPYQQRRQQPPGSSTPTRDLRPTVAKVERCLRCLDLCRLVVADGDSFFI